MRQPSVFVRALRSDEGPEAPTNLKEVETVCPTAASCDPVGVGYRYECPQYRSDGSHR